MKVLIAKHYWKNGENATWEHHPKLDKKIFEYLKENYHNFVKERNSEIEQDGHFIYLCYEDAKDDHNRDITNITFFISKSKPQETSSLCGQKYENLELKVKSKKYTKNLILMVLGIVTLFVIGFFGIKLVKKLSSHTQEVVQPKEKNYSRFIDGWNEQVQNITEDKSYLLIRGNNTKLIVQLNSWEKVFYEDFNKSKKVNEHKGTEIDRYQTYVEKNHIDKKIIFEDKMSKDEIQKALKSITKETAMFDIVNKVLMMNDIDIFLKEEN